MCLCGCLSGVSFVHDMHSTTEYTVCIPAMELLCHEDIGVTKPAEINDLPLELIEQAVNLMPLAKRKQFKDAAAAAAAAAAPVNTHPRFLFLPSLALSVLYDLCVHAAFVRKRCSSTRAGPRTWITCA